MYAAPALLVVAGAPTTAVFPDAATDVPNPSKGVAAGSASVAVGLVGQPDVPFT